MRLGIGLGLGMRRLGNTGGGAASDPYGPELIDNPNFATGTDWTLETGFTISGGKLNVATAISSGATSDGTDATLVNGETYHTVFTIDSISVGAMRVQLGGAIGTSRSTPGTYTEDIISGDPAEEGGFVLACVGATIAACDTVSCREVL